MKPEAKVQKVMREFKEGKLHSGSKKGPEVKSRKQAVAIALNEAGKKRKMADGGAVIPETYKGKKTEGMPVKEVEKMIKERKMDKPSKFTPKGDFNEEPDTKRMKSGGKVKKMAAGGMPMVEKDGKKVPAFAADGKGKMAKGGCVKKMAVGGMASYKKGADGIATKGKTKPKMMKKGGMCK